MKSLVDFSFQMVTIALLMELKTAIDKAIKLQLSQQNPEGYWWYTLEANESIGAEYIQLMHFLGCVDKRTQDGLTRRIISEQRQDGGWSLYYGDEGDLSIAIECYFVLKLAGHDLNAEYMKHAREFILERGGITKSRVFTRIHLAMFGLVDWSASPVMPIELILLPKWMPVNIYEFSSWARACIIPLLLIMYKKPVRKLDESFDLEELYVESADKRDFQFKHDKSFISWENFFIQFDRWLKLLQHTPLGRVASPLKKQAVRACEKWIDEHIASTEDIYPAMAYAAMGLHSLGHSLENPTIQKALGGLKRFQHSYSGDLATLPEDTCAANESPIHQQCCVSPVWDTPWSMTALLDSGVPADDPQLVRAARWLISKQITRDVGDWKIKNPYGRAGGWSFEFENDYFPDVDDTIQVLHVLQRVAIPEKEKKAAIEKGLAWMLSMQNDDGGWAAFDKNNNLDIVNKIPFSDHGACLDPSSPDITARVIALLVRFGFDKDEGTVKKAISYLQRTQEPFGGWFGRWGVNYIYGTWTVLVAMRSIGELDSPMVKKAVDWLMKIQKKDGGWSESPETYKTKEYVSYKESVPSQTAWALMGLIAAGLSGSDAVKRGVGYLTNGLSDDGSWTERYYTGTGFPGHFYIRYHGYRHFFPLMALGQYRLSI